MVSDRDKATITALARRYGAATVWLFGSSAEGRRRGRDLDLAVEGVAPARFFQFVGDLMLSLSRPVDVVALEKRSKLGALIRREGLPIYGQPARDEAICAEAGGEGSVQVAAAKDQSGSVALCFPVGPVAVPR